MECIQRSCSSSDTTDYNKNKLLFKFKIPKNCCSGVHEQAGGSNMNISNNNFKRVCPECNKEFDSGQALGGHMRIHAQPVKDQHENYSGTDSDNSMSDYYVSCSLCDKEFPSIKPLFGHMRCHSERDWRGIRPPCGYISSWSISEDDDEEEVKNYGDDGDMVVDCAEIMPKWPVKGPVKARRGHKGIKRGFSVGCDDDDEEEMKLRDVVSALMLLSQGMDGSDSSGLSTLGAAAVQQINGGDQHHEEVTNNQSWIVNNREEEFDDTRFVANGFDELVGRERMGSIGKVVMRKMGTDQEDGSSDHVMKDSIGSVGQGGNAAADHVAENHHVEDESDGMNTELVLGGFDGINDKVNHGEKMVMENSKNNKDNKMKMVLNQEKASAVGSLVQAAGAWTATDKYKCSTCDKTFSSHQALGGHRSSHNKIKVTIINGESSTKKSISAFAPPDHKFNQSHQQQLNTSHDQLNRVPMSEECATKRNSIYELGGSSKSDHISSTIHQCSVCNKIFASGQALGGHKRSHWTAPAAEVAQTVAQADQPQPQAQLAVRSSGEEASTQAGGKRIRLMGFDLNVPASMVDDAAQYGGAGW